ncbi:MAG: beta-glucanase [Ruminococcus sp.]
MRRNRMSAVAISLAVVLGIGAAGAFPAVFAEQQNVTGDVNGDGVCDSRDVRQMQRYLLGAELDGVSAADVNGDGVLDGLDLAVLRDLAANGSGTGIPDYGTPMDTTADAVADFRAGESPLFFASDGWTNGNPFDCGWYAENAVVKDGALHLSIDKDSAGKYNYSGGEYRTNDHYSYGYYETSMQAIKNDGVVSSFFTYTGPSEDNPWDEIDIEVLGKDTTKVQFNYYTNGQGNHEYMYDLGFDASEGYHTYGFDWQEDSITWYVDGKAVYTATSDIPSTPGRIMMNTWPGIGVDSWLKAFDGTTPLTARYQWVTYKKNRTNLDTPSDTIKDYGTPMDTTADAVADFRAGESPLFFASDGWTNGNPFDCGWYAENAVVKDGALHLSIDKDSTGKYNYSGGEYRTNDHYSYGYYETSMQAIKNDGVVSSFFTYTGPSEDNPWDEIDIEVLGKDTTKVQFNYYTNGQGNHEYMYDLGFDASEGYHTYGFDWQEDSITWYVDGKAVYTATIDIPSTPGRIMMNTWPGIGVDSWLKAFDGTTPLTARYQWVTYKKNRTNPTEPDTPSDTIKDYGTPMDTTADAVADFRAGESPLFFASDGWTNGNPFDCGWYAENAVVKDGALHLSIDKDSAGKYNYSGGEYRTNDHYSYGYYETSMQAIKNDGVVSSFFTYTGPSENNPWDEIDIEVLGKDTTKVQLNYYTNGQGNHEYMYDLGFDASEGYHTYGFDWQADSITWYVDGKAVYTANSDIPSTPGRIMMNTWPGIGVDSWLKAFDGTTPLTARYQWVTYKKNR